MIRKIFKTGHSLAVTVSRRILEELGLKVGDKVSLEVDKAGVVVKKARSNAQLDLGLKIRHRLGETLRRRN